MQELNQLINQESNIAPFNHFMWEGGDGTLNIGGRKMKDIPQRVKRISKSTWRVRSNWDNITSAAFRVLSIFSWARLIAWVLTWKDWKRKRKKKNSNTSLRSYKPNINKILKSKIKPFFDHTKMPKQFEIKKKKTEIYQYLGSIRSKESQITN